MRVLVLCLDALAILVFLVGAIGYLYCSSELRKYYETLKSVKVVNDTVVNILKDDKNFVQYAISCNEVLEGKVVESSLYPKMLENCIKVGDMAPVKFFGDEEFGTFLINIEPFSKFEAVQGNDTW